MAAASQWVVSDSPTPPPAPGAASQWVVSDSPTPPSAPNLDANPNGQGTYNMLDNAGQMHAIPYSLVPVAKGQGYQFDSNPIKDASNSSRNGLTPEQQFIKDEAADPNRTGGPDLSASLNAETPDLSNPNNSLGTGVRNLVSGAVRGVGNVILHPIDTVHGMGDAVMAGGVTPYGTPLTSSTGNQATDAANAQVTADARARAAQAAVQMEQHPAYSAGQMLGPAVLGGVASEVPELARPAWEVVKPNSPISGILDKPRGTVAPESATPTEL